MSSYYYPIEFIKQIGSIWDEQSSWNSISGITVGGSGPPVPDFPYKVEYLDTNQIVTTPILGYEKRFKVIDTIPRKFILTYPHAEYAEMKVIKDFYILHHGSWDKFRFVDIDEWIFNNHLDVIDVRFASSFTPERFNKSFYRFELTLLEVF